MVKLSVLCINIFFLLPTLIFFIALYWYHRILEVESKLIRWFSLLLIKKKKKNERKYGPERTCWILWVIQDLITCQQSPGLDPRACVWPAREGPPPDSGVCCVHPEPALFPSCSWPLPWALLGSAAILLTARPPWSVRPAVPVSSLLCPLPAPGSSLHGLLPGMSSLVYLRADSDALNQQPEQVCTRVWRSRPP